MKKGAIILVLCCVFLFGISYRKIIADTGIVIKSGDYYVASLYDNDNVIYSIGTQNIYIWDYHNKMALLTHSDFNYGKQIANSYNLSILNPCFYTGYFTYSSEQYRIADGKELGWKYYLRLLLKPHEALKDKIIMSDTYLLNICFDADKIPDDRKSLSFSQIISRVFSTFSNKFGDIKEKFD